MEGRVLFDPRSHGVRGGRLRAGEHGVGLGVEHDNAVLGLARGGGNLMK